MSISDAFTADDCGNDSFSLSTFPRAKSQQKPVLYVQVNRPWVKHSLLSLTLKPPL